MDSVTVPKAKTKTEKPVFSTKRYVSSPSFSCSSSSRPSINPILWLMYLIHFISFSCGSLLFPRPKHIWMFWLMRCFDGPDKDIEMGSFFNPSIIPHMFVIFGCSFFPFPSLHLKEEFTENRRQQMWRKNRSTFAHPTPTPLQRIDAIEADFFYLFNIFRFPGSHLLIK